MLANRTHIIHERTPYVQRTIGYRVIGTEGGVNVVAAEARCHPNDLFNKKIARSIVDTRLDSAIEAGKEHRVFRASVANINTPTTAREWRELEQTIVALAEFRLPEPAALAK